MADFDDTPISLGHSGLASIPLGPRCSSGQNLGKTGEIACGILANSEGGNCSQGNRCDSHYRGGRIPGASNCTFILCGEARLCHAPSAPNDDTPNGLAGIANRR